jgi:tetratricopeptide (TPR) repeat protein
MRTGHSFICYSSVDGLDFAQRLAAALEGGDPSFAVWFDKYEKERGRLRPGEDWDEQVPEGIKTCESLLFLMTVDSVRSSSECKREWTYALKCKKPIIPIWVEPGVEMPFRLEPREGIDGPFDSVIKRLRAHLLWLRSPAGALQALRHRLADAERALPRAKDEAKRAQIDDDIKELQREIREQEELANDPQGAARRMEDSIARRILGDRETFKPSAVAPATRFLNPPPTLAPSYFQDRYVETKLLVDFLADDARRIIWVVGRGGAGKTALVCRLLKAMEAGQLPDGGSAPAIDGIVYLSAIGSRRIGLPHMYADLCRLLPEALAKQLLADFKKPHATTRQKMEVLLTALPSGRVVVLLDNFEDVIDSQAHTVQSPELDEALRAVLSLPPHAVKVLITTRVTPRDLLLEQPGRHARLDLDTGLSAPYAEEILRAMDADGKVGLKSAPEALLSEARVRTHGNPRALEALFAILSADRDTSLPELLQDTAKLLPENVLRTLVGEAFSRLDALGQQIMQALATYGRPVSAAAVDYLLQPHQPGVAAGATLARLVNMHFVRKEEGRYYLHPTDAHYAFERIVRGEPADRQAEVPVYSRYSLLHRAANYFRELETPREQWQTLADLAAPLAEFDLRCLGEEYDVACAVLSQFAGLLQEDGYYHLCRELHQRLDGKVSAPELRCWNVHALGDAESRLGHYQAAISRYEQALALSRDLGDAPTEYRCLYSLGWCHGELGDTTRAVEFSLNALRIAERTADPRDEADGLSILGWYHAKLGKVVEGIDYANRAVSKIRGGDADSLAYCLTNLSGILIDAGRYREAIPPAVEGLQTADVTLNNWGSGFIALAHLMTNDLPQARHAAELAVRHDEPENNPNVRALLGIISCGRATEKAPKRPSRPPWGKPGRCCSIALTTTTPSTPWAWRWPAWGCAGSTSLCEMRSPPIERAER